MINNILNFLVTFVGEYSIVCFFGVIFIGGGILLFKGDKKGLLTRKTSIGAAIVIVISLFTYCFISYINPNYTCIGFSTKNFEVIKQQDNILACIDDFGSTNGKSLSRTIYRLQGLDLNTGKILYQTSGDNYFNLLGQQNEIAWYQSAYKKIDITGINIKTGKVFLLVNEDYLVKIFPELQAGVYTCAFNKNTQLFDIESKDAKHVSANLINNKRNDSTKTVIKLAHYSIIKSEIKNNLKNYISQNYTKIQREHLDSIRDKQLKTNLTYAELDAEYEKLADNGYKQYAESFISLRGKDRQQLYNQNGELLNKELDFLQGEFILYDSIAKNVFVLSYKTLDKFEFTVSCVSSITGKLIWYVNNTNLNIGDFFTNYPKYTSSFFYNRHAIFTFEGFVVSLNKNNGAINWHKRI